MLLLLNSFLNQFTAVLQQLNMHKHAVAEERSSSWQGQRDITLWPISTTEPQGTRDNIVHKQNPCAKSVSCKHNLPPDQWEDKHQSI